MTSLVYQNKVPSADLKSRLSMDGVASADTADAIEPPHWTTYGQKVRAEVAYVATYYLAALSVTTPKVLNLG